MKYVVKHTYGEKTVTREFKEHTTDTFMSNDIYRALEEYTKDCFHSPEFEVHMNDGRIFTVADPKSITAMKLRKAMMGENEKVWCETIHQYVTKEAKDQIEGGCCEPEEICEAFKENIYTDVFGYDPNTKSKSPRTGKRVYGVAFVIITDGSERELLADGWDLSDTFESKDEDGCPFKWFSVREKINSLAHFWNYDRGTREWCFEGKHLHAYYQDITDENDLIEVSFFAVEGSENVKGNTENIKMKASEADKLIEDIEQNPEKYILQSSHDYKGNDVFALMRRSENMATNINGKVPSGWEYLETPGDWVLETKDEIEPDAKYVHFAHGIDDLGWYAKWRKEEMKLFFTAKMHQRFKGLDAAILADVIGDCVFSDDPIQTLGVYLKDSKLSSSGVIWAKAMVLDILSSRA